MQTPGKHQITETLLRIDPRFRDRTLYPNTNEYRIEFGKTFKYVVGIRVHSVRLPITEDVITEANNTIAYIIQNQTIIRTLDPGPYTAETLVTALNDAMTGDITVSIEPVTNRLRFESADGTTPFRFDISSTTMARVLGFVSTTGYTPPSLSYSPQGMLDMNGCSYIVLRSNDIKTPGTGMHTDPGLAIIDINRAETLTTPLIREYPAIYFDTLKEKMTGIHIRLERDDGTLYDTKYTSHYIVVRLSTLNERLIQMRQ